MLETPAQFVALPLYDGEMGIAPAHSPFIGRWGYGELRVKSGGETKRYYVDGGFVQVAGDWCRSLPSGRCPPRSSKPDAAKQPTGSRPRQPANTPELLALRDRAELQARAQLRMARRVT